METAAVSQQLLCKSGTGKGGELHRVPRVLNLSCYVYIYIDLVCLVCYGLFQFVSNAMYKNRGRGEIPACVCSKCRMHNA